MEIGDGLVEEQTKTPRPGRLCVVYSNYAFLVRNLNNE